MIHATCEQERGKLQQYVLYSYAIDESSEIRINDTRYTCCCHHVPHDGIRVPHVDAGEVRYVSVHSFRRTACIF